MHIGLQTAQIQTAGSFLPSTKTCLPTVNKTLTRSVRAELVNRCIALEKHLSKKVEDYNSIIDFVLCNVIPEFRPKCREYYDGNGRKLREIITKEQLQSIDATINRAIFLIINRDDCKSFKDIRFIIKYDHK